MADDRADHDHHGAEVAAMDMAIDPVCGMKVDPATSKHHFDHGGQTFHFCSERCRGKFAADPVSYLKPDKQAAPAMPKGTIFTCPMHPEIRQEGPRLCPICGMTLETLVVSAEAPVNHELVDMTRRFWIGLALSVPVVALEMGAHVPWLGLHNVLSAQFSSWIQFALATPVVLWAGWPFFQRAWMSVVNRSLNMFSLIALGTGAAYIYSLPRNKSRPRHPCPGSRPETVTLSPIIAALAMALSSVSVIGNALRLRRLRLS